MITIKIFVPTYFDKFNCIADKCPDTCCIGWEVDIDSPTAQKYKSIKGELADKIHERLTLDETGEYIFTLCEQDRCPFLNSCKLCEIQLGLGEEYLSNTCTMFPRFYDDFGAFREMGLGFGCPEAARLILENDEPFDLIEYGEKTDESDDVDEAFVNEIIDLRAKMFAILENRTLSIKQRIHNILDIAREFQKAIDGEMFDDISQDRDFEDCLSILKNMEYISDERRAFIADLKDDVLGKETLTLYSDDFEKLLKYYIFRYLLKSAYDYDVLTKVKYGIFACIVIGRIYAKLHPLDFDTRVKIMYSYSKEVEYSDLNIQLLDDVLYNDFGTDDLLNLI